MKYLPKAHPKDQMKKPKQDLKKRRKQTLDGVLAHLVPDPQNSPKLAAAVTQILQLKSVPMSKLATNRTADTEILALANRIMSLRQEDKKTCWTCGTDHFDVACTSNLELRAIVEK